MLSDESRFKTVVEVNPPTLPDDTHMHLDGVWSHVLITDNIFGTIRVSPYAFAARITHDVPAVHPTIVVSTRDRNLLAIESEVRGALGNGVDSFLVVAGDTYPAVERLAGQYEVTEHLRTLQSAMPRFEVGMPIRFHRNDLRRRADAGAQFLVTVPVLDADAMEESIDRLDLRPGDPPVYAAVIPPFSPGWIERAEGWGAVSSGRVLRDRLEGVESSKRRAWAWQEVDAVRRRAEKMAVAGVTVMSLRFDTAVGEAAAWLSPAVGVPID